MSPYGLKLGLRRAPVRSVDRFQLGDVFRWYKNNTPMYLNYVIGFDDDQYITMWPVIYDILGQSSSTWALSNKELNPMDELYIINTDIFREL